MARTLLALLVLIGTPVVLVLLWYATVVLNGDVTLLFASGGFANLLSHLPQPSLRALIYAVGFFLFEGVLLVALPGKRREGPTTPKGEQVYFKYNGALSVIVTYAAFGGWWLGSRQFGWTSPSSIYDELGSLIATVSILSVAGAVALYFKGVYAPSGPDAGTSGNFIFDFFWGTELYPRIGGIHLKHLANARFGVMGWGVLPLAYVAKQYELYGHVSSSMLVVAALMVIYVAKFLFWEEGYYWSLDMIHDRYGWYLCWGVTTWLPVVYTSSALFLTTHPIELHPALALLIFAFGMAAMLLTTDADSQRQRVRRTNGQTTVWRRKPVTIEAEYTAADGSRKTNLLLASGWWGVSRHFNYTLEILLGIAWTLPCGFSSFVPWVYPIYLLILLSHRAMRDDRRCREKYGPAWADYCARVRYKIVPGIF